MTEHRAVAAIAISLFLATAAVPTPAAAQAQVALDSAVYVERADPAVGRTLEPARQLSRGDRVVYVMRWQRVAGSGGFTVTNPLPRSVYFQGSADGSEEVSIDGGRSWGKLENLRLGNRFATAEDVTHVRWKVAPAQAAQGAGRIAYSAIVR